MNRTGGFTLLEVVLATSLLAGLTAATFSWVSTMGRFQRAAAQRLDILTTAEAIGAAIRDDLTQELPSPKGTRFSIYTNRLEVITLHNLPGDPPGAQRVTWYQDDKIQALVREVTSADPSLPPTQRVVSRNLLLVRFARRGTTGPVTLICRTHDRPEEYAVPLTMAGAP